jgi:D-alanyl-D-alanine carboxypeptidase/D-alanyl-D-alanine-endopeptidase (penicillin-binding protein 4)
MNRSKWAVLLALILPVACTGQTKSPHTFSETVRGIMAQPEFRHASFGIEFYSLDSDAPVFAFHAQKLFTPGSTTKLLTEGTALQLLGPDFRFHTVVYHTGKIDSHGTLKGDLILVASGDPNLSSRIQPDGTLAFKNEDHSYGGLDAEVVAGDPLAPLHEIADQIASHGIKKVKGRILVDATLFHATGRELGTGVTLSAISVNDNVIDIIVTPAEKAGAPASISISPAVPYLKFENKIATGNAGSDVDIDDHNDTHAETPSDGTQVIELTGSIPLGSKPFLNPYAMKDPVRFAEALFTQTLVDKGIAVEPVAGAAADFAAIKVNYTTQNRVAEHISPPLSEEVKVTLKVSQNLHASMTPYILGSVLGHQAMQADHKGFDLEHDFLQKAGLDLSGASQADGAGGAESAFFTPDFIVHYLAYMSRQSDFALFHKALPILGRDGTLAKIQSDDPAAGHVFAKTGTFGAEDLLNKNLMLVGKGLAGYTTTASGQHLAFALYLNHVSVPTDPNAADRIAGQALGAIAAAAYDLPIDATSLDAK